MGVSYIPQSLNYDDSPNGRATPGDIIRLVEVGKGVYTTGFFHYFKIGAGEANQRTIINGDDGKDYISCGTFEWQALEIGERV